MDALTVQVATQAMVGAKVEAPQAASCGESRLGMFGRVPVIWKVEVVIGDSLVNVLPKNYGD